MDGCGNSVAARGMAYGTGTDTAALTVGPEPGQIVCRQMWYTSAAAGTIGIYRTSQKTKANAAVAASATLVIDTDAKGYVGGKVLSTSDYVLVCSSTGTVWSLRSISAVAAVDASTVSLTLASAITCAEGDTIYIARAADIVTVVTGTETVRAEYCWNGFRNFPVHVLLTATGTDHLSVAYDVER